MPTVKLQVHTLVVRCAGQDFTQQQLGELLRQFPNIQNISVATGSWSWTGCRSLNAWATTLTLLQANHTSFPLADEVPSAQHVPSGEQQHCRLQNYFKQHSAACHDTASQPRDGPAEGFLVQRLRHLELRCCLTTPIKCRQHGSADCDCLVRALSVQTVVVAIACSSVHLHVLWQIPFL